VEVVTEIGSAQAAGAGQCGFPLPHTPRGSAKSDYPPTGQSTAGSNRRTWVASGIAGVEPFQSRSPASCCHRARHERATCWPAGALVRPGRLKRAAAAFAQTAP